MPRCPICDGEDFEEIDGRYYCDECHTESQDVRDLQQEANYVDPSLRTRRLRETGTSTPKKGLSLEESCPWYTHEAFQVIIKAQVETLINMGVSPRLKDIVKQLWFTYLSRCGVAFTGAAKEQEPPTQDDLIFRQQDRVTKAAHRRKAPKHSEKDKSSEGESTGAESTHDPFSSLASSRSDVEPIDDIDMYIRGTSRQESDTSDTSVYVISDNDSDDDRGSVDSRQRKAGGRRRSAYPIQRMTMLRTLCFSYLGVLWLQEPVLPSDIIRWVREGHVPYMAVKELLPKHMKLGILDVHTFSVQAFPSYQAIHNNSVRLARFLQLPQLPQVDLSRVASRFILDLNLPAEMHRLVQRLLQQRPLDPHLWCNRKDAMLNHEAAAMALIIVALKLLFGLDDNTERSLSESARDLQSKQTEGVKLFVFEDWMCWAMEKKELMATKGLPRTDRALERMRDVEEYTDYYKQVIAKWKQNFKSRARDKFYYEFLKKQENREAVQRPFQSLSSEAQSHRQPSMPTSFPLSFGPCVSTVTHPQPEDIDFKCHTLKYITDRQGLWTASRNYPTYPDFKLRHTGLNTGGGRLRRETDQEHLHDSYEFLLELCANLIEQDKYSLHHYVATIEKLHGSEKAN